MLSRAELFLAASFLERAADEFSYHSCNDIPPEIEVGLTQTEKDELNKAFHAWNGDPENYLPGSRLLPSDASWMSFLSSKLCVAYILANKTRPD